MLIADHETSIDFLNYDAIAHTVVDLIKVNHHQPLSVGIHGDWGAGKTSVLKMIESALSREDQIVCIWFNGWALQGFDDAKMVLIESIIGELSRQRSDLGKVKEFSSQLLRRVDWLKLLKNSTGLVSVLSAGLTSPDQLLAYFPSISAVIQMIEEKSGELHEKINDLKESVRPEEDRRISNQIHQFRNDFEALLNEAQIEQLVVLIDDLDRCLPEMSIDTLEAIRLFLFVPKTTFVIGADESMIEYSVRQHFPDLPIAPGPMQYARNYLEKLIQVPFRIPALGIQETTSYVTFLLIESMVGSDHEGFKRLLIAGKGKLNRPWMESGLQQPDVESVDDNLKDKLGKTYVLAQQIGPILAEGSKGNPRQIKRYINSLLIRQKIARAKGFGNINQAVLAKLMLVERFHPEFYEFVAARVMTDPNGQTPELEILENQVTDQEDKTAQQNPTLQTEVKNTVDQSEDESILKWLERDWIKDWLQIEPTLSEVDLRPYVFIAREKRQLTQITAGSEIEELTQRLCGSNLVVRSVEPKVKGLSQTEAEHVFSLLREKVLRSGSFKTEPDGFYGLCIVAKHHPTHQLEIVTLLSGIQVQDLGFWIVKGWNEILTETNAKEKLIDLIAKWAEQGENPSLKTAARRALDGLEKGTE